MEQVSSDDVDVDEDGNPIPPEKPSRQSKTPAEEDVTAGTLAAAAPAGMPAPPLIRPQAPGTGTTLAILAQHFDLPQEFAAYLRELDSSFLRGDYTFVVDINAYWKVKYSLDHIVELIAGQVDVEPKLRVQMPKFLRDYFAIEDAAEDWEDEIRQKVFQFSKLVKVAGLGTSERERAFEAVPADRMRALFRFGADLPAAAEVEKYGVAQIAAYWKENMIDLGLDIFCVVETPKKIYPFGTGKTRLMIQIAGAMAKILEDDFDPRRDVAYATDLPRVRGFFDDHEMNQVRVVDEGKVVWGRRTAMTGAQKRDMGLLSMTRKDRQVWLVAVSNVFRLDQDIFEEKATHVLRITDPGMVTIKRGWGQAILYEKTDCDEDKDTWGRRKFPVKWVDFKAGSGIAEVLAACDSYTKAHVRMIVEDDLSPLNVLLSEQPDWNLDKLKDWMPNGGAPVPADQPKTGAGS